MVIVRICVTGNSGAFGVDEGSGVTVCVTVESAKLFADKECVGYQLRC